MPTETLGVELLDGAVVAVAVDSGGHVQRRALVEGAGDLSAAADAALAQATTDGSSRSAGVATLNPDAPGVGAIAAALAARTGGSVLSSGLAAALAETWVGAAKGARDAVYFAVGEHPLAGLVRDGHVMNGAHGRAASVAW